MVLNDYDKNTKRGLYSTIKFGSLQGFDIVGWATGRASGLQKAGCWFVGGDNLTGALHVLQL